MIRTSSRADDVRIIDPKARMATTEAEALEEPCDAVLVCSPPVEHLRQLRRVLDHGRDAFVEKPFSHSLEGTEEVIKKAEKDGRVVLVGCNLRFFSSLRRTKQLLDPMPSGALCRRACTADSTCHIGDPSSTTPKTTALRRGSAAGRSLTLFTNSISCAGCLASRLRSCAWRARSAG